MEKQEENKNINKDICFHCGSYNKHPLEHKINGVVKYFCCMGCKTACELIYYSGADSYYETRDIDEIKPLSEKENKFPFESSFFREKYIEKKDDSLEMTLYLENIHCPSCIWVIEKVLEKEKGMESVQVNYTNKKAKITWNDNVISLEKIVNIFNKIGYPPQPIELNSDKISIEKNNYLLLALAFNAFGVVSTMFLLEPFYFSYVTDMDITSSKLLKYLSLVITTPIYFMTIKPFFKSFINSIKYKFFNMDANIFMASLLIYAYSVFATITNKNVLYFDCLNMFLFFIILGRIIEQTIKNNVVNKYQDSFNFENLYATISKEDEEKVVHLEEVKIGDVLVVKNDDFVPLDGHILYGEAYLNESLITGESTPVKKIENDTVIAGSRNEGNTFYYKVSKNNQDSTINQIKKLIQEIGSHKSDFKNFTDKYSNIFFIVTSIISVFTFLLYLNKGFDVALLNAVSVIVSACPCALGLAMPLAVSISSYNAIKKGILFKTPDSFQKIANVNQIILDKTGTITLGKIQVTKIVSICDFSENKLMEIACAIERFSEHPIAWSIVKYAYSIDVEVKKASGFQEHLGKGVEGIVDKNKYFIGNYKYLKEQNINNINDNIIEQVKNENLVFISNEKNILGFFFIKDELRDNVQETIDTWKNEGYEISIISGDKKENLDKISNQIGIDNNHADFLPKDKLDYVSNLNKNNNTMMIGDGINDTLAMKESSVSISVCANNNIVNTNVDVIVLNKDFESLLNVTKISKRTYENIKQSVFISILYNIIVIPLAVSGNITPLIASILMPFSSLLVIINSSKLYKE